MNFSKAIFAWRLSRDIAETTDGELEAATEACEKLALLCAAVVIVGVVAEFIIAISHPSYDSGLERWGSILADAFVAVGIVGEVFFGMIERRYQTELRHRSDERVARSYRSRCGSQ